jgi:DNA primase
MPEGIYREMLADSLAARVSMPAAALKKSFLTSEPHRGSRERTSPEPLTERRPEPKLRHRGRISVGRGNLLTQAITLVLHHPTAAKAVADPAALKEVDKPGVAVLQELLAQAASAAKPSTAMLLERWRDLPEYGRLSELAMAEPLVAEPEAAAKELQMAVEKLLQEYGPGRRTDELLRKAEELGLNYDEKTELSLLLKSKGRFRAPP